MFETLLNGGSESVELLLTGVLNAAAEEERLLRFIAQLDHDEFRIREAARKGLLHAGLRAMPLLKDPQRKRMGAEGEQRVASILESFEMAGLRGSENGMYGESLRHIRAVRLLELLNTKPARAALEEIAKSKANTRGPQEAAAALVTLPASK